MKGIRKKITGAAVLAMLALAGGLRAGQPVAEFLTLSGSSRHDGMGGAYTSMFATSDAVGINPAGIYGLQRLDTFFTFFELAESTTYTRGFIGDSFGKYGVVGANIAAISSGAIENTTVNSFGDVSSTGSYFGVSGQSYSLTYANSFLWDLATGMSLKIIREDYAVSQSTMYAADIGFQRNFFGDVLRVGAAALNIGPSVERSESNTADYLPLTTKLGVGYKTLDVHNHKIVVNTDVGWSVDRDFLLNIGFEYTMFEHIFVRAGMFPLSPDDSFAVGMGFRKLFNETNYAVDYAMHNNRNIGLTNRITVKASWQPVTAKQIKHPIVKLSLEDGSVLVGKIMEQTDRDLKIEVFGQGAVTVNKKQIKDISKVRNAAP